MDPIEAFSIPNSWKESPFKQTYVRISKEAKLDRDYQDIEQAELLAKMCIDPAIDNEVLGRTWNPKTLSWQ